MRSKITDLESMLMLMRLWHLRKILRLHCKEWISTLIMELEEPRPVVLMTIGSWIAQTAPTTQHKLSMFLQLQAERLLRQRDPRAFPSTRNSSPWTLTAGKSVIFQQDTSVVVNATATSRAMKTSCLMPLLLWTTEIPESISTRTSKINSTLSLPLITTLTPISQLSPQTSTILSHPLKLLTH